MLVDIPQAKVLSYPSGEAKIKIDNFNQRIKLVKYSGSCVEALKEIRPLTKEYKVGKIIYIASAKQVEEMTELGFVKEAVLEGFFRGETGFYVSKFINEQRKMSPSISEEDYIIEKAQEYEGKHFDVSALSGFSFSNAGPEHAEELAKVYDSVFETYPTPMNNPQYIKESMDNNMIFKIILYNGKIVSVASADMDPENLNAEITDCATLPVFRGHGLMARLVYDLEQELQARKYVLSYTIARAISYGMNIVFAKLGYKYAGRLINNCHICGQFENMNIWSKTINNS